MLLFPALVFFFTSLHAKAQAFRVTKNITVNDGLPSNIIHALLEDDKGFLWIATDNGIARFDGKYFRIFNTNDGLPDNEILDVFKEKDGTIWVNTFKQGPFYFDDKKNIFIDPLKAMDVNKEFSKLIISGSPLEEGGIAFYNEHGAFVFKDRKLIKPSPNTVYSFIHNKNRVLFYSKNIVKDKLYNYIYCKENNKIDSVLLYFAPIEENITNITLLKDKKLFTLTSKGNLYIAGCFNKTPFRFGIDSINTGREPASLKLTNDKINIITKYGEIYSYDMQSLALSYVIKGDYIANCVWEDRNKNVWVGTCAAGIMLYKQNYIHLLSLRGYEVNDNFLSLQVDKKGEIYSGNNFGEVLKYNAGNYAINLTAADRKINAIRKIIVSQNKVFTFSEQGSTVDYKNRLLLPNKTIIQAKTAVALNDSIIIIGGVNLSEGLYKLNTITANVSKLNWNAGSITSMAQVSNRYVYVGTLNGIYKYDYVKNAAYPPSYKSPLSGKRITALESTGNHLISIGTSASGLYIVYNDNIVKHINDSLLSDNAITSLRFAGDNSLWVGTRNGLNKIKYRFIHNNFEYSVHSFYVSDGLPANTVNDIVSYGDFIYVATEKGICYLHKKMIEPPERIRLYLTRMVVNNKDLEIKNAYLLRYSGRSVKMEFSGANLGGHLKKLMYSLDEGATWTEMQNNTLNLELVPGNRKLLVKASNLHNINEKPLTIYFKVIAPVYLRTWFIALAIAVLFSLIGYIFYRNKLIKEKRLWDQKFKLNQERNRITADLHDDIGSTISSLQIYSEVAYNLVDTDKEKSKVMLKHITDNSAKIAEDISDIIWSLKDASSSSLSLSGRIKNFISEVLGPTGIKYEIDVIHDLHETENILWRKNVFLIIKEAINNMLKYSNASFLKVELHCKDKNYILSVEDDGKGFDPQKTGLKGNGLANMKKRTEDMGGHFEINTSPGSGTKIKATIPVQKMCKPNKRNAP